MGDEVRRAVKRYLGKERDLPAFRFVDPPDEPAIAPATGFDRQQAVRLTGLPPDGLEYAERYRVFPRLCDPRDDMVSLWAPLDLLFALFVRDFEQLGVPPLVLGMLIDHLDIWRESPDEPLTEWDEGPDLIVPRTYATAEAWLPRLVRYDYGGEDWADDDEMWREGWNAALTAVDQGTAVRYSVPATARDLLERLRSEGLA